MNLLRLTGAVGRLRWQLAAVVFKSSQSIATTLAILFGIGCAALTTPAYAQATVTFYTDRAAFEAAAQRTAVIDFEGVLPDNQWGYQTLGLKHRECEVTFSAQHEWSHGVNLSGKSAPVFGSPYDSALLFSNFAGAITATVPSGVTAVGGFFGTLTTATAGSFPTRMTIVGTSGAVLDERDLPATDMGAGEPRSFFGWIATRDTIASVTHAHSHTGLPPFYRDVVNNVTISRAEAIDDFVFGPASEATRLACPNPNAPVVTDTDNDGVNDATDNCPTVANTNQTDNENDGIGDACDADDDNDGVSDTADNCSLVANLDQANADGDAVGDACDADRDGDDVLNSVDNCPTAANADQTNTDGDGVGDECDTNDDNDQFVDEDDNCPTIVNNGQENLDSDRHGDACDADLDGDGFSNNADNCPRTVNLDQTDTDFDRTGDMCDADDDNDGVLDGVDNCDLTANPDQADTDRDGKGNACNNGFDADSDEWSDTLDNCPAIANGNQHDYDGNGVGDACDTDVDGDGVANTADICAATPLSAVVDATGCTIAQLCPCGGPQGTTVPWKNHGKYVSCVAQAANAWRDAGLIGQSAHGDIVNRAGQTNCGQ